MAVQFRVEKKKNGEISLVLDDAEFQFHKGTIKPRH